MKSARKRGIGFGTTSGVITTLGLMTGMYFTNSSLSTVIGGILIIAIADAMSDALGIHISTEAEGKSEKEIWSSTKYTFIAKLIVALIFIPAFFFAPLKIAVILNILLGFLIIIILSYRIAKSNKKNTKTTIIEHLIISTIVIILSTIIGKTISFYFN